MNTMCREDSASSDKNYLEEEDDHRHHHHNYFDGPLPTLNEGEIGDFPHPDNLSYYGSGSESESYYSDDEDDSDNDSFDDLPSQGGITPSASMDSDDGKPSATRTSSSSPMNNNNNNGSTSSHLQGEGLIEAADPYLDRRNRRIQLLRKGRMQRQQQTGIPLCMEEHPYYLVQQEQKLQQLQQKTTATTSSSTSSSSFIPTPSVQSQECQQAQDNAQDSIRQELVAAYRLIHKQRIRIQQLEKQPTPTTCLVAPPPPPVVSSSDEQQQQQQQQQRQIRALQNKLVRLELHRAEGEFNFRNRITTDAIKYHDRLAVHKSTIDELKLQAKRQAAEMVQLQERIRALEEETSSVMTLSTVASSNCSEEGMGVFHTGTTTTTTTTSSPPHVTSSSSAMSKRKNAWKNMGPSNPELAKQDLDGKTTQYSLLQNAVKKGNRFTLFGSQSS